MINFHSKPLFISDVKAYSIVAIIILALFVIFDLIALFGTGKVIHPEEV